MSLDSFKSFLWSSSFVVVSLYFLCARSATEDAEDFSQRGIAQFNEEKSGEPTKPTKSHPIRTNHHVATFRTSRQQGTSHDW